MNQIKTSVLIIVKSRHNHLRNVLHGLELGAQLPDEVVVVHMNEPILENYDCKLNIVAVRLNSNEPLPLAAARNMAAETATNNILLFLDVDCIPSLDYVASMSSAVTNNEVLMCDPYYLSRPINVVDFDQFERDATVNPARSAITFGVSEQYELFWSLGFSMTKTDYQLVRGFDESFIGYGGEDTDFAFSLRKQTIALRYTKYKVYHQYHDSFSPPLNWLKDICVNATQFKRKWGTWPMEGWLQAFEDADYIRWNEKDIDILRYPSEQEIVATKKTTPTGS